MSKKYMKQQARKRRQRERKARSIAKILRENPPKSELWFYELYEPYRVESDKFNQQLLGFVPDVSNTRFKYIIEIDGSIHDLPGIKEKDNLKTSIFRKYRYHVIRVKHGNLVSFEQGIKQILHIRNTQSYNGYRRNPDDFAIVDGKVIEI